MLFVLLNLLTMSGIFLSDIYRVDSMDECVLNNYDLPIQDSVQCKVQCSILYTHLLINLGF